MRGLTIAVIGCLLVAMAAIARAESAADQQVLAKVGDGVITIQDFLLLANALPTLNQQGDGESGKQQLLEGLIGQVLFAAEAERLGLDQSPEVQVMLKQARMSILTQAYLRWHTAQGASISDEEVQKYFEAHRDDFKGKTWQEAAAEIRAKLAPGALKNKLARARAELKQREGVVIDEKLLNEISLDIPMP